MENYHFENAIYWYFHKNQEYFKYQNSKSNKSFINITTVLV